MTTEKSKKPFYKKWWVWVIAVFIVAVALTPTDDTPEESGGKITDEVSNSTADAPKEEPKEVEKAPVVVYQDASVVISFKENTSKGVKFLVENKTNKGLTIQADSVAINGFSAGDITMSDDVAPQSKGYVTAKTSELTDVGEPETVSGKLRVIDFDTFDSYDVTFTNVSLIQ